MTPPLDIHDGPTAPHSPLGHVEEWEPSAIDYLEGRLSLQESSAITEHLAACPSCREKLAEQKWMVHLLDAVEAAEVPRVVESGVFDHIFPAGVRPSPTRATQPGVVRRLLEGAARRPWVPAAIAAVVVMVALAGSADVLRFGGGADSVRSDLNAPTAAGEASTAGGPAGVLTSSPPSSSGAPLAAPQPYDDAGNTVAPRDALGTDATVSAATQTTTSQTDIGDQGSSTTMFMTATTVDDSTATASGGRPAESVAPTSTPTIWASAETAVGDVYAAATIEGVTGLRPLAMESTPGTPIYAAMIRRNDVYAVLRQLDDAGLAVTVSDAPQAPLDRAAAEGVQKISELPYLKPVSPQGDTLSPSIESPAADSDAEYVRLVLSAVR